MSGPVKTIAELAAALAESADEILEENGVYSMYHELSEGIKDLFTW